MTGEEYVVYTESDSTISLCSRTRSVSDAQEDFEDLGEGQPPQEGAVVPTPDVSESGSDGGCVASPTSSDVSWLALAAGLAWLGLHRTRPG